MKYLKKYKIFESAEDDLLHNVKEAFYTISDKFSVDFAFVGLGSHKMIGVVIKSKIFNKKYNMKLEDIKDDLEFAMSYLDKELKLTLDCLYVLTNDNKKYNRYEDFLNDISISNKSYIGKIPITMMMLYFRLDGIQKRCII